MYYVAPAEHVAQDDWEVLEYALADVAQQCNLCGYDVAPILVESTHWRLVLNHNQNLLGNCFLVLRRHLEAVTDMSSEEWADLHRESARATEALKVVFQPDHFNYPFLQNQDRHVHLHIIPRYAGARTFAGLTFTDPDYPSHYAVSAPVRTLSEEQATLLVNQLRQSLRGQF